jgi:uncharacterized protein (DUF2147 family)
MARAILGTLALTMALSAAAGAAGSPVGEWVTEGGKARVRIAPCSADADRLCGTITWTYRPDDAPAGPLLDRHNQDAALRARPIIGLPLLQGFKPAGAGTWDGGTIYDPEGGRTYKSRLRLQDPDRLEVQGCILFVCRTQIWRRHQG